MAKSKRSNGGPPVPKTAAGLGAKLAHEQINQARVSRGQPPLDDEALRDRIARAEAYAKWQQRIVDDAVAKGEVSSEDAEGLTKFIEGGGE